MRQSIRLRKDAGWMDPEYAGRNAEFQCVGHLSSAHHCTVSDSARWPQIYNSLLKKTTLNFLY
jgi:hypothetical protein